MFVTLNRYESRDDGTFGILKVNKGPISFSCHTVEPPWRHNARNISSIPSGVYETTRYCSSRFGWCYLVGDVSDRSSILIHPCNWGGDVTKGFRSDTRGCIGLGLDKRMLEGQVAVTDSLLAVAAFESWMGRKDFMLEINNDHGKGRLT